MTVQQRISDKPFIADIVFVDGTTRRIDYAMMQTSGSYFTFFANKDGTGPLTLINARIVATIECNDAAQPVGRA